MKKILLLMLSLIIIGGMCEKDDNKADFSGVLLTDDYGNIQREYGKDDGDWEFNDEFNSEELRLFDPDFNTLSDYFSWSESERSDYIYPQDPDIQSAWPNPAETNFNLCFVANQKAGSKIKIVIVNNKYESLANFEFQISLPVVVVTIKLSEIDAVELEKIHRIYYMLIVDDTNTYCGHGDFILTESRFEWWQNH